METKAGRCAVYRLSRIPRNEWDFMIALDPESKVSNMCQKQKYICGNSYQI